MWRGHKWELNYPISMNGTGWLCQVATIKSGTSFDWWKSGAKRTWMNLHIDRANSSHWQAPAVNATLGGACPVLIKRLWFWFWLSGSINQIINKKTTHFPAVNNHAGTMQGGKMKSIKTISLQVRLQINLALLVGNGSLECCNRDSVRTTDNIADLVITAVCC